MNLSCLDDLSDTELYVRYAVSARLHKCRHDHFNDNLARQLWCDHLEGFERTHSVVVALLLNIEGFDGLRDQGVCQPFDSERSSHLFNLDDAHIADGGSRVGQILEEDTFQATSEDLYAELDR